VVRVLLLTGDRGRGIGPWEAADQAREWDGHRSNSSISGKVIYNIRSNE